MKYSIERGHIELELDKLCFELFGRHGLDGYDKKQYLSLKSILPSLISRTAAAAGGEYYMSVSLSNTSRYDGIYYYISGVCDGVQKCGDGYCVYEIVPISKSGAPLLRQTYHMAHQMIAAYILCRQKDVESVRMCTVTYNTKTGEMRMSYTCETVEALRGFYLSVLSRIHDRGRFLAYAEQSRIPSLANVTFPYRQLRPNQEDMIRECYRDIKHGSRLFCQAPTGIGKTISTLYPSVKCVGERVADKIFYLTSKASIRREALSAARRMRECGADIYTCVLSAKEQMCLCEAARGRGTGVSSYCRSGMCPYAEGYYTRSEAAVFELIAGTHEIDRDDIIRVARAHRVCPHELSLDVSELCDIIICDYNYVFSSVAYLKRYFSDGDENKKYIFLVDEAHNLVDRARDMFSARLGTDDINAAISVLGESSGLVCELDGLMSRISELCVLCEDNSRVDADSEKSGYYICKELPVAQSENIDKALESCMKACERWMIYNSESPAYDVIDGLYSKMREYCTALEHFGKNYIIFISTHGQSVEVLLYCLDPSPLLDSALSRARASVLFSATLTPTEYFADILGGGKCGVSVSFESPFPPENLCVAVVDTVSTRYSDRRRSHARTVSCIAAAVSGRAGNYMVFLPSYGYMEDVAKRFSAKYPKVRTVVQKKGMTMRDKEEFLNEFQEDGKLRVGFCVIGGSFSEGIDLPGDRLIGAIVVGVGLPSLSNERNIMRDYYDEKCGRGYDYAYTYQGMNSVLQAVGRVIRREEDRGIAVLIDDRYAEPRYRELFPSEWRGVKYAGNAASLAEVVRKFWKNDQKNEK